MALSTPENVLETIAVNANDIGNVPTLVEEIVKFVDYKAHEPYRQKLLRLSRELVQALETPQETVLRLCWAEPTLYGAILIAIDCGIFIYMNQKAQDSVHVDHLAQITDTDPILIARVMKHLAAMGIVLEIGPDSYVATNMSRSLALAKYADGFTCMWVEAQAAMNSIYQLPSYFRSTEYQNPNDATDGPFQFAYGTYKHWFSWISDRPEICRQFNNHMSAYHQGRPSWMDSDFYPVRDSLLNIIKSNADAVLLVDVGGGLGHDLKEFHIKYPLAPGRLIVQDKPDVIEQIHGNLGKIEKMGHDFFTPQPIKGARAYYLHSVLHDWPDHDCQRILKHITAAMLPGYSKLLINENVVPDQGADWQITGLDMMLMSLTSARERRESEWRHLLTSAGLRIINIWSHVNGVESLIECQLMG